MEVDVSSTEIFWLHFWEAVVTSIVVFIFSYNFHLFQHVLCLPIIMKKQFIKSTSYICYWNIFVIKQLCFPSHTHTKHESGLLIMSLSQQTYQPTPSTDPLFCSSLPLSHVSVILNQHVQDQSPETKAAEANSAIIILPCYFGCDI